MKNSSMVRILVLATLGVQVLLSYQDNTQNFTPDKVIALDSKDASRGADLSQRLAQAQQAAVDAEKQLEAWKQQMLEKHSPRCKPTDPTDGVVHFCNCQSGRYAFTRDFKLLIVERNHYSDALIFTPGAFVGSLPDHAKPYCDQYNK